MVGLGFSPRQSGSKGHAPATRHPALKESRLQRGMSIMELHDRLGRKRGLKDLGVLGKRNGHTKRMLRREPMAGD